MRESTFEMRERGCQMRHFRAIAQDLAALIRVDAIYFYSARRMSYKYLRKKNNLVALLLLPSFLLLPASPLEPAPFLLVNHVLMSAVSGRNGRLGRLT